MIGMCKFCKDRKEVENMNGQLVCESCYEKICLNEAALEGYKWWIEALENHHIYQKVIDKAIKEKLEKKNVTEEIVRSLEEEIKSRLQFYHKDEIFTALLAIKESIRRLLIRKKKPDWLVISDASTVNLLMKFTNEITEFENHPMEELENGCSYFANAICYARRYNMIVENIVLKSGKDVKLEDICFEPIQSEATEKFFSVYLKNGLVEKPEDYVIQNKALLKRLEEEKKTPDKIIESLNGLLKQEFGFEREDYQLLTSSLFKMEFPKEQRYWDWVKGNSNLFEYYPVYVMEKSLLINLCGEPCLEEIMNIFSINRNLDKHENVDELELFCFYETENFFVFGNFDLLQVMSAFEKFLVSGHYIDIYKEGISKKSEIREAQKTISKYFSACVCDYLFAHGYRLPMQRYMKENIPLAEVDKIKINGKNILTDKQNRALGDIDVLAINENKKEILLLELKFYKPAITTSDMLLKDKSKIDEDEVIRHMQERENAISAHVDGVVKFVLGEEQTGYTVKSILLTSRTNFYAIQEEAIQYLTWAEFMEKVDRGEL